jgi:two-component system LytT family sensor kinase
MGALRFVFNSYIAQQSVYPLRIFRISTALLQELRQQRKAIFGHKRYWFHLTIWTCVAIIAIVQASQISSGLRHGFDVTEEQSDKTETKVTDSGSTVEVSSPDSLGRKGKSTGRVNIIFGTPKDTALSRAGEATLVLGEDGPILNDELLYKNFIIGCMVAAIMVYFFLLFVIPYARHRKRKRVLIIGLLINLVIFIIALSLVGLAGYLARQSNDAQTIVKTVAVYVLLTASISMVVTSYFFAIYYFIDLYDQQKNLNRFQKVFTEKIHAETAFLKTQINPHFLFNTLNNIYSLTLSKPADAALVSRKLKNLLHYMLDDCSRDMVPLEGEIDFLRNYITLEQLRNKRENVDISLQVTGNPEGKQIAPLLLINFIENAFKHGVKSGIDHSFVHVNLYIMDNILSVEIRNSKPSQNTNAGLQIREDGGIGIRNVRRRLEMLYPNRHKLSIGDSTSTYHVHLNITLS